MLFFIFSIVSSDLDFYVYLDLSQFFQKLMLFSKLFWYLNQLYPFIIFYDAIISFALQVSDFQIEVQLFFESFQSMTIYIYQDLKNQQSIQVQVFEVAFMFFEEALVLYNIELFAWNRQEEKIKFTKVVIEDSDLNVIRIFVNKFINESY